MTADTDVVKSAAAEDRPLVLVAALAEDDIIGCGGSLPWHLPEDLRHFRRLTMGKPLVMGRRTFESIGRPLPGRDNIVLSGSMNPLPGVEVCASLAGALRLAQQRARSRAAEEIAVIGGATVYAQTLPLATRLYLTRLELKVRGDTRFPRLRAERWVERSIEDGYSEDAACHYRFIVLERNNSPEHSERSGSGEND